MPQPSDADTDKQPLLRLITVRMQWRPTPLYAVQQRFDWGPHWLRRIFPYRNISSLYSRPEYACADAFGRAMARDHFDLCQAIVALGHFEPNAPFPGDTAEE